MIWDLIKSEKVILLKLSLFLIFLLRAFCWRVRVQHLRNRHNAEHFNGEPRTSKMSSPFSKILHSFLIEIIPLNLQRWSSLKHNYTRNASGGDLTSTWRFRMPWEWAKSYILMSVELGKPIIRLLFTHSCFRGTTGNSILSRVQLVFQYTTKIIY